MSNISKDDGVFVALMERLERQRLPRALEIKKRVDAGSTLSDNELEFLQEVQRAATEVGPIVARHPEWHEIYTKVVRLHKEISEKALENEKAQTR